MVRYDEALQLPVSEDQIKVEVQREGNDMVKCTTGYRQVDPNKLELGDDGNAHVPATDPYLPVLGLHLCLVRAEHALSTRCNLLDPLLILVVELHQLYQLSGRLIHRVEDVC